MTLMHRLRRTAHRLLPILGIVALLSAGHTFAEPAVKAAEVSSPVAGHCHDAGHDAAPPEAHRHHSDSTSGNSASCCQYDCQCPFAVGAALAVPFCIDASFATIDATFDFPAVPQLATQWRQDLQRPPI